MIGIQVPAAAWEDVEEGTEALLDQWLVVEGEQVAEGQPVANVVVVKTNYEVTAPATGTIAKILVQARDTFGKDQNLALLEEAGVAVAAGAAAPPAVTDAAPAAGAVAERVPLTGLRGIIARNMTAGWQAPRVAAGLEVDMTSCLALQRSVQQEVGGEPHITVSHLVLRAVALTLREHPRLNARVAADTVEVMAEINVGFAVNLEDGLMVPVIRGADQKSIAEIAAEMQRLADDARQNRLPPSALQGGTFTVSNLGATGIDWFTPVLNAPQVGIIGVGRVVERAVVRRGRVEAAPTMVLTLIYDHRAVDGFPASVFLAAVRDRLEQARDL